MTLSSSPAQAPNPNPPSLPTTSTCFSLLRRQAGKGITSSAYLGKAPSSLLTTKIGICSFCQHPHSIIAVRKHIYRTKRNRKEEIHHPPQPKHSSLSTAKSSRHLKHHRLGGRGGRHPAVGSTSTSPLCAPRIPHTEHPRGEGNPYSRLRGLPSGFPPGRGLKAAVT